MNPEKPTDSKDRPSTEQKVALRSTATEVEVLLETSVRMLTAHLEKQLLKCPLRTKLTEGIPRQDQAESPQPRPRLPIPQPQLPSIPRIWRWLETVVPATGQDPNESTPANANPRQNVRRVVLRPRVPVVMLPRVVVFDLMSTLIDGPALFQHAVAESALRQGRRMSASEVSSLGAAWYDHIGEITRSTGTYVSFAETVALAAATVGATSSALPPYEPDTAISLILDFWRLWLKTRESAIHFVASLTMQGFEVCVLGDCSSLMTDVATLLVQQQVAYHVPGFRFSNKTSAQYIGYYLPHPEAYASIRRRRGEVLFLSSCSINVEGAQRAGLQARSPVG